MALFMFYEALTWPDVDALIKQNPKTTAFIEQYKSERKTAGQTPAVSWRWVPYESISANLKLAALVAEDADFFSHNGFATDEIKQALDKAWDKRRLPRGASTITQQVAKNLWLSPSYNPLRKLKEALLTIQLERNLRKRRILEIYLNIAEFGPGIYGAEAASRHYFGKSAQQLTETEAAGLVAGLPKPSRWHPGSGSRTYNRRVRLILSRMSRAGFLRKEL